MAVEWRAVHELGPKMMIPVEFHDHDSAVAWMRAHEKLATQVGWSGQIKLQSRVISDWEDSDE